MRATRSMFSGPAVRAGLVFSLMALVVACGAEATPADSEPGAAPQSTSEQALDSDRELLQRAHEARTIGPDTADVTLDEYVDFACPDCRDFTLRYSEELEALVREENVRYSMRLYPIPRLMRGFQAAEAVLCAGAVGGQEAFLAARIGVFERMDDWRPLLDPRPVLNEIVGTVGVSMNAWLDCTERDAMAPLMLADVRAAVEAGLTGTPTFFFNRAGVFENYVALDAGVGLQGFRDKIQEIRDGAMPDEQQ